MITYIDNVLNKVTMYRLVLYILSFLIFISLLLSTFGFLSYNPFFIALSTLFILAIALFFNTVFSRVFRISANVESVYITALILVLIISPMKSFSDFYFISLAFWSTTIAIASKFIFAINKKHIFNPAALGIAFTALFLNVSASWWIGTASMLPFAFITGLLIARKIRRGDLMWSFMITSFILIVLPHSSSFAGFWTYVKKTVIDTPIIFFAFVMLTEPLTTPPKKYLRIAYGAIAALLYAPYIHIGNIYSTPELALIAGNVFSFIVSPKYKLSLILKEKRQLTKNVYEFIFESPRKISFKPGQYLEWTLPSHKPDSRGNRRYFTISSSPTENEICLGVKFYDNGSSYKKALLALKDREVIDISGPSGEFTLPSDRRKKIVFIAGGIGSTPFRSMAKYLIDIKEKRDIVFLYSNYTKNDIAYSEIFNEAYALSGMKTYYFLTSEKAEGENFQNGKISETNIKKMVPDFHERYYYISGAANMVRDMEYMLMRLGIKKNYIKTDFFPGF